MTSEVETRKADKPIITRKTLDKFICGSGTIAGVDLGDRFLGRKYVSENPFVIGDETK